MRTETVYMPNPSTLGQLRDAIDKIAEIEGNDAVIKYIDYERSRRVLDIFEVKCHIALERDA